MFLFIYMYVMVFCGCVYVCVCLSLKLPRYLIIFNGVEVEGGGGGELYHIPANDSPNTAKHPKNKKCWNVCLTINFVHL